MVCVFLLKSPKCDGNNNLGQAIIVSKLITLENK